jgi:hypothetical protein
LPAHVPRSDWPNGKSPARSDASRGVAEKGYSFFFNSLTIDDPDESRRVSRGRRIAPVMLSDHITCPLRKMNPMGALLIAQP